MTVRINRAVYDLLSTRSRSIQTVRAVVGDGCGNITIPDNEAFIWIRPYNRNHPFPAYCPAGSQMPYDAVVLAEVYHVGGSTYYMVRSADPEVYARGAPASVPSVGAHASQHMYEMGGGDIVFVHPWQMSLLRTVPTNPASMKVYVASGEWWTGGTLHQWPGGESDSLASYVPSTEHVRYVVVHVNAAFDSLGYEASPEYADNPYLPAIDELNIPTPPGVIVACIVKLYGDTTAITSDLIYPIRTFVAPDAATEIAQQSLFLAAQEDALYKSVAGLYTWVQLGSAMQYLTEGITGVVACSAEDWVVFREQATASVDDPLVYRTTDAGLTWAQSQSGMDITQGTDLWKVYAVWRDPTDPYRMAIAVSAVGASKTPLVFTSENGGAGWIEVDNTGLPTFTCDSFTYPRCLGVRAIYPPVMCIALGEEGLYYKNDTADWIQKTINDEDVLAVREDWLSDGYWVAVTTTRICFTDSNWTSYTEQQFEHLDVAATRAINIYQNMTDRRIFTVQGYRGLHTTWSRAEFHVAAPPLGEPGPVLLGVPGATSMLLLTDVNDNLFLSTDFGLSSLMSLSISDIIAADGVAPYGLVPVVSGVSGGSDFEICKAWLLGS